MMRAIGCWVVLAGMALAARAEAIKLLEPGPRPVQVRFDGYVGDKPAGLIPEASWLVSCQGKEYAFHVSHITVLTGDVSPMNIITAARPFRLHFYLRADEPTLTQFATTPAGQKIAMIANLRGGSRQLLVSKIEPAR